MCERTAKEEVVLSERLVYILHSVKENTPLVVEGISLNYTPGYGYNHLSQFRYVEDGTVKGFEPNSDMGYSSFYRAIKDEWNSRSA